METPTKLPFKFVFELTTLVSKVIGELIAAYNLPVSSENMYEIGKQVIAIGLTLCVSSKHADKDATMKDVAEINEGITKSVEKLQEHIEVMAKTNKVVDKNVN